METTQITAPSATGNHPAKRCPKCGEVKPTTEFYKNATAKDGLQTYCKHCKKAAAAAIYAAKRPQVAPPPISHATSPDILQDGAA